MSQEDDRDLFAFMQREMAVTVEVM
jgi:hypothetical protein